MPYLSFAEQREICLAILRGEEDLATKKYRVSDADKAALRLTANAAIDLAVSKRSIIREYYNPRIRNPVRWGYIVAAMIVLMAIGFAGWISYHAHLATQTEYPLVSAAATLFAVGAATAGWGTAGWISHRNARVQHTINFVANRFTQNAFSENTAVFNAAFVGKTINADLIGAMSTSDDDGDKAAVQALRYLLNYFEFVSVGVLSGDLDSEIVRRTLKGNLVFYFDKCAGYVMHLQIQNPRILEHLVMLRRHYQEP